MWSNANLYLGFSGGGNTMVISNAGRVANSLGHIRCQRRHEQQQPRPGHRHQFGLGLRQQFVPGATGSGNSLVISNGGRVNDSYSELGGESTSSGNSALITGPGSVWNNTSSCTIGRSGSNNRMTINKGGRL